MSEPLPAPQQFNLGYDVRPMDIGSGYAAGITEAGKSIAAAIGSVSDIATQNVNANDMLTAMHQSGKLKPEEYEAVMNKSLGAKQQMIGLYTGDWVANQAMKRQQALAVGKGAVDVDVEHQKLLDQIAMLKAGYSPTPGKLPFRGQTNEQPPRAQPVNPPPPAQTEAYSQSAGLRYSTPPPPQQTPSTQPKTGVYGQKMIGGKMVKGFLMPDGSFRPLSDTP